MSDTAWFLVHVRQGNNVHNFVRAEVEADDARAATQKAMRLANTIHDPHAHVLKISERPFTAEESR